MTIIASRRLPETIWRVLAEGDRREYWEGGSRQYSSEAWAQSMAERYRKRGATEVRIYRADLTWKEVPIER